MSSPVVSGVSANTVLAFTKVSGLCRERRGKERETVRQRETEKDRQRQRQRGTHTEREIETHTQNMKRRHRDKDRETERVRVGRGRENDRKTRTSIVFFIFSFKRSTLVFEEGVCVCEYCTYVNERDQKSVLPQETGVGLLGDVEQAAVALGRDAGVEEDHVQVPRLRLDAGVDKVLKRLLYYHNSQASYK